MTTNAAPAPGTPAAPKIAVKAPEGTFDQVKSTAVTAYNWVGKQISVLTKAVQGFIAKIAEFVKPYLAKVATLSCETYHKVRDYLVVNKDIAAPVAIGSVITAFVVLGSFLVCCKGSEEGNDPSKAANKA